MNTEDVKRRSVPIMITTNEFYFTSADGADRIYVKEWLPHEEPSAILIVAHGLGEHIGRYDAFAAYMAEYGVLVAGPDHPGHGRTAESPERLGFFAEENGWQTMVDNLHILQNMEQDAHPGVPVFLMGHGMGALLVRCCTMDYADRLRGAILCGCGDQPEHIIRTAQLLAAAEEKRFGPHHRSLALEKLLFGPFNRKFAPNHTKFDWFNRDEAAVNAFIYDPLTGFIPTVSAFRDLLQGMRKAQNRRNQAQVMPDLPIFILGGEMDPVGGGGRNVQKMVHALQDAGVRKLTVKLYADSRHDLLHELNRGQVYNDILTWLGNRL
jgi:alpha-beta hydrolase superfamily lysophospholipase